MWNKWAALLAGVLLLLGGYAMAGDEEGCLFCHRLELHQSSALAIGSNLRVWDPPGGLHDSLYCSDCHQDAKEAPHPALPGPATCIGECHGSDPEATASHRRASFGGANETHRILSSPRAPCLLCHRATDKKGDTGTIESRCGGCHAGERNSVAQGVHARFYRKDEWELCARCHRVHTEGENSPQVACNGQGCHGGEVTEAMRRLGSHETKGGERKTAGKIPRAGVFLLIAAFGWVSGRFLSPTGKGGK
jgi:hypothetical protein